VTDVLCVIAVALVAGLVLVGGGIAWHRIDQLKAENERLTRRNKRLTALNANRETEIAGWQAKCQMWADAFACERGPRRRGWRCSRKEATRG
jgi:hypothetical protein